MLIPFPPPANKFCGVSVFCLQVGLKVNVMCQCATARCSALLQIAPDCLSAGCWELGVPGHCTCITTLGHGASHGPVGGETIQWRFSAKSLFFKYRLSHNIIRSLPMTNADISTDDNYNIVFCAAKYPNIISYWCGRQCYLELRVRVLVLMLIYCDNQDTIPHLGKGITIHNLGSREWKG